MFGKSDLFIFLITEKEKIFLDFFLQYSPKSPSFSIGNTGKNPQMFYALHWKNGGE